MKYTVLSPNFFDSSNKTKVIRLFATHLCTYMTYKTQFQCMVDVKIGRLQYQYIKYWTSVVYKYVQPGQLSVELGFTRCDK